MLMKNSSPGNAGKGVVINMNAMIYQYGWYLTLESPVYIGINSGSIKIQENSKQTKAA